MYRDKNVSDELKKSTDIVNIISEYINLTKTGVNYIGLCPFHQDTKPSLYVSPEKKVYKCFSCNKGGSRRPSGLRKTTMGTNSLAHKTTWLKSKLNRVCSH